MNTFKKVIAVKCYRNIPVLDCSGHPLTLLLPFHYQRFPRIAGWKRIIELPFIGIEITYGYKPYKHIKQ